MIVFSENRENFSTIIYKKVILNKKQGTNMTRYTKMNLAEIIQLTKQHVRVKLHFGIGIPNLFFKMKRRQNHGKD